MLTKILIIATLGTAVLGSTNAGFNVPKAIEISAGALRIQCGDGHALNARIAEPTSLRMRFIFEGGRILELKF